MRNKPNVIYILADDMGYGDVSHFNENCGFKTENFDEMCERGLSFEDAHASSSLCTPSRYGILTGRYNWRSRLKNGVLGGYSKPLIEEGRETVANLFKNQGYKTACIGKWHLGLDWKWVGEEQDVVTFDAPEGIDYSKEIGKTPNHYGFDYFYGISSSLDMPPYVYIENNRVTMEPTKFTSGEGKGFWRKGPTADDFNHEEVFPNMTDRVIKFIEDNKKEPFFIYYPMPAPHTPILPLDEFKGKSALNEYGDFVMMCDSEVGRINKCLKDNGLYDNTIVIFTSDNGFAPMAGFQELIDLGHNPSYKFRGHKADIYEGGHRVPLIITWPDKINGGRRIKETVSLVDFMATMAELFEVKLPSNMGEDSVSNLEAWLNEEYKKPIREATVSQSDDGSLSIRKGDFKLEMCPGSGGWSYPAPNKDDTSNMPSVQLYNLKHDIGEKNNICEEKPEIVRELKILLAKYIRDGRSTYGEKQKNDGVDVWPTIEWIKED
ncbi:sulfatase family protein [Clostridium sp. B9]|uniref:sulfatase family protein n=1 Tax=Clostridium sp. B9 TaxID=3423224 RepID=UPI003D2EB517